MARRAPLTPVLGSEPHNNVIFRVWRIHGQHSISAYGYWESDTEVDPSFFLPFLTIAFAEALNFSLSTFVIRFRSLGCHRLGRCTLGSIACMYLKTWDTCTSFKHDRYSIYIYIALFAGMPRDSHHEARLWIAMAVEAHPT